MTAQQLLLPAADRTSGAIDPAALPLDLALWGAGRTPTILVVDNADINRRLLKAMLRTAPYRILEAGRAAEAIALLESEPVDLIILDMMLPEMSGLDFCRRLKTDRRTHLLPVILMTSLHGVENEIAGLACGADEFLAKPLHPALLRTRIQAMLRHKAAIDSLEEAETILFALAQAVESRDKNTSGHCQRLATYAVALGIALGLTQNELLALYRGGYLHDIGKIAVPDAILFKEGRLDEEEWLIMRSHTVRGEEICRPMKSLAPVLPIIRHHHERWDGSGYPDGLSGEQIPLLARVLQVADVYDALTTVRPYKTAFSHEEAIRILESEARKGWRDPELVSLFANMCARALDRLTAADAEVDLPSMAQSLANMNRQLLESQTTMAP